MDVMLFNIQKFSMQDGPGIRTTVFLKGCPLSCQWCHNPESISSLTQESFNERRCIQCHRCAGGNIGACPTEARREIGYRLSVEEVLLEIDKDQVFYEESGGGVTFSGGEPLFQSQQLLTLLKACKDRGYHTAVDTSGYAQWEDIERMLPYTDLFLYDLKHFKDELHRIYTGVSNQLILENLKRLSKLNCTLWIRMPIIKEINDQPDLMKDIGRFLASLSPQTPIQVFLLPYHELGVGKYKQLGITYNQQNFLPPSQLDLTELKSILKSFNLDVKIGGYYD
jgi:pyruvate formate lyase activating enzyme